jgi:Tfp pilus assembly protein PilZ
LQAQPSQHPAVMAAMEAVAGALGNVHALTRFAPAPAPQPAARAPAPQGPQPRAQAPQYAQPAAQAPAAQPRGAAPKGDGAVVAAELGAHSQTNFYKGLSGNDIIDHGGLFVSTYQLPKIGQPVRLKVSMPGGYEFEANAVVRWCREQSEAGNDAPPGFGAQFVEITPEARQLVYRYVRNREPMFHDDL